jgi:Laminin G domain
MGDKRFRCLTRSGFRDSKKQKWQEPKSEFDKVRMNIILHQTQRQSSKTLLSSTSQVDGAVFVVYNVGLSSHPVGELEHKVNDGNYHVMRFQRRGQNASLQLDDRPPYVKHPPGKMIDLCLGSTALCSVRRTKQSNIVNAAENPVFTSLDRSRTTYLVLRLLNTGLLERLLFRPTIQ